MDPTKLGDHTLVMTNTVSYGGSSWTPTYTFDVTVEDPCSTTVL